MTGPEKDKATARLEGLEKTPLVSLLVELAEDGEFVRERMERLRDSGDPRKLAAGFRRALTGWGRSSRMITYGESGAFAAESRRWLQQVEQELVPLDAKLALDLFEAFIESDGASKVVRNSPPSVGYAVPPRVWDRKNRTISAEASGPALSV